MECTKSSRFCLPVTASTPCTTMFKIGRLTLDNPLILAPMAGHTDTCARRMARRLGAGLVYSEMVSSGGLARQAPQALSLLARHPEEDPLAVQIFGSEPAEMAEAARLARSRGAALLDINLGCPDRRVCRSGAGAALLLDPPQVGRIIASVRKAIDCPLTVKMRLGWDHGHISAPEIARIAEECGADAVTLHPRTRTQGFQGAADWAWVAQLKEERRVPVIGSGDIHEPAQAYEVLRKGICHGVMIGRAARGNPWIFEQARDLLSGRPPQSPSHSVRYQVIIQHFEWLLEHYGNRDGARRARFLLFHYTKGIHGAALFRKALCAVTDMAGLRELMTDFFVRSPEASPVTRD